MKLFRTPSLKKSLSARASLKRAIMPRMPRGMGIFRNPSKALYNKVYNRVTISPNKLLKGGAGKRVSHKSYSPHYSSKAMPEPSILTVEKLKCPKCGSENQHAIEGVWGYYFGFYLVVSIIAAVIIGSITWFFILLVASIMLAIVTVPQQNTFCMDCKHKWDS